MARMCTRCGGTETNQKYIAASEMFPGLEHDFICIKCFTEYQKEDMELTFNDGKWMEHQMKGHEVWTHHTDLSTIIGVDGSVCIGIVGERKIMYGGETYEISVEQADKLWKDVVYGEYGTTDHETILKVEGFE